MKGGSSSILNPESPIFIPSSLLNHLYHIPTQPLSFPAPPPLPPTFPTYPPSLFHPYYTHYYLPPPQILNTHLTPPPPVAFQHYPEFQKSPAAPPYQLQADSVRQALTQVTAGPRCRPKIIVGPRNRNKELIIQTERRHIIDEKDASNSKGKMIGGKKFFWREMKKADKEDEEKASLMIKNNPNERLMGRNIRDDGGRNKFVRGTKKGKQEDVISLREDEQKTTIMIKNIPNEYTRGMLLQLLDQHCCKENEKAKELISAAGDRGMVSAYDFVYLPIDFWSKQNKGYAFVNFVDTKAVWKFDDAFNETSWDLFKSKKIINIVSAKIQDFIVPKKEQYLQSSP